MSNKINSIIKLRSDTIANWLTNSDIVLNDRELSIIKYSDNSVGFKLGDGSTYANTPLLKFNSVITNNLSDGENTFTFPSSGGTLDTQLVNSNSLTNISSSSQEMTKGTYILGTNSTSLILKENYNDFVIVIPDSKLSYLDSCYILKKDAYFWLPDGTKYAFSFPLNCVLSTEVSNSYRIKIYSIASNLYKVEVL